MKRIAGPVGVLFLILNVCIAALWFTVLSPGSQTVAGRAAQSGAIPHRVSDASPASHSNTSVPPLTVPLMLVPGSVQYAPLTAYTPIVSPHGELVAQLGPMPQDLAQSVGGVFPSSDAPVNAPRRAPSTPRSPDLVGINFAIVSVIRYEGSGGTVYVSTGRPSAAALSRELGLGSQSYRLPNGSTAWTTQSMDPASLNQVRWLDKGRVITVAGSLSLDRLEAIAADVVVR